MLDVTEQLRRYGDAVTETVDPVAFTPVESVATTESARTRRRRLPVLVAAAVALVVLAGGVVLASRSSDPEPASKPRPDVETGPDVHTGTGVALLDPGPLAPRADAAVVWTGQELVVWGGDLEAANLGLPGPDRSFADGATYDPATGHWRRMAKAPLPDTMDGAVAARTTQGVVIVRGTKTALWTPATNTWRALDDAPAPVTDLTDDAAFSVSANAQLDPASGHWRPLPPPPVTLSRAVGEWTGTELLVVGGDPAGHATALSFVPSQNRWRETAFPPQLNPLSLSAARDGDAVVIADYEMHVVRYRRRGDADAWSVLPPVPTRFSEGGVTVTATPSALVAWTPSALAVRVGSGEWLPMPYGSLALWSTASAVQSDGSLLVYGLSRTGQSRLLRLAPVRLADASRELQVGLVTVFLPDGVRVVRTSDDVLAVNRIAVVLSAPTGACTVSSAYVGQAPDSHTWVTTDGGRTADIAATTSDTVKIHCEDAATTRQLVDGTRLPPR